MQRCDECGSPKITLEGNYACPDCDQFDDKAIGTLISQLEGFEARSVLRSLARRDEELATQLIQEVIHHLEDENIDAGDVADDVFSVLSNIPITDVWDNAGETRRGEYVEPEVAAAELAREELRPYEQTMERYVELSMQREARAYCKGLLEGLYRFKKESNSEFIEWAPDTPRINFDRIRNNWTEICDDPEDIEEVAAFLEEAVPEWA